MIKNINQKNLISFIRKLFNHIKNNKVLVKNKDVNMSMSGGVSYFKSEKGNNGYKYEDLYFLANTCLLEAKKKKGLKGNLPRYTMKDLRKVENVEDYRINKRSLPKKRTKNGLMKLSYKKLTQLYDRYYNYLSFARTIEEKEIIRNNLNLIKLILSEITINELQKDIDRGVNNIVDSMSDFFDKNLGNIHGTDQFKKQMISYLHQILTKNFGEIKSRFNKQIKF